MNEMKAVQFSEYGDPDVLHVASVATPTLHDGEVLVEVAAAGVNTHDLFARSGSLRLITGRKFPMGLGIDFAGRVSDPGTASEFEEGGLVWGSIPAMAHHTTGAQAEYVAVAADRLSPVPTRLDLIEAASLVVSGTTALRALRDETQLRPGDRLLVRGAGGAVGLAAVQLGAAMGAHVSTLSSSRDFEALRELGAEETFDYRAATVEQLPQFDVVFDTVGTQLLAYRRLLTRRGRMVTIAFTSMAAFAAIGASFIFGPSRIRAFSSNAKRPLLEDVAAFVENGQLDPIVESTYRMDQIADAHRSVAAGGRRGRRVIVMANAHAD